MSLLFIVVFIIVSDVVFAGFSRTEFGASNLPKLTVPENFKSISVGNALGAITVRLGSGTKTLDQSILSKFRPRKPIILYEYEANANCRIVREACSILDLVIEFRPCPNERSGFSDMMAMRTNGMRQVPFMIDENPKFLRQELYTAPVIVNYLFDTYGGGKENIPPTLKGNINVVASKIASFVRGNSGSRVIESALQQNQFRKPIDLWGFEGDPSTRPVREVLNSLSLAHRMVFCAPGSANRQLLEAKIGKFDIPYIDDPNTGIKLLDSSTIVKYLLATYTVDGKGK